MTTLLMLNQQKELSIKSEHRRLEQCRNTPNSVLQSGPIPHSYPRSSPRGTTNEWSGTREKHSRVSRPTSITIQAEVHDTATAVPPHNTGGCDNKPVSKGTSEHFRNQDDMTASERGAHVGLCTDDTGENDDHSSEGDRDESAQLLVCDIRGNGRQEDVDVNTSVYCETRDTLKAEKIAKTYGQAGTYNDGTTKSSESDADSPEDILSPEYTEMLEEAFVANHLYGNSPPSVIEAVHSIILQAQLFLQRLNYLSVSYQITGEFDDITLRAVQMFQRAHNHHGAQYSMTLPENGHLTSPTYQFLRQAYLLIYASMLRIGLDKHLGENYDPMSTAPQDAALFRKCVSDLQTQQGLKECQAGSMCANTITRVKQMLHTQKGKPVHHVDKKNVCV